MMVLGGYTLLSPTHFYHDYIGHVILIAHTYFIYLFMLLTSPTKPIILRIEERFHILRNCVKVLQSSVCFTLDISFGKWQFNFHHSIYLFVAAGLCQHYIHDTKISFLLFFTQPSKIKENSLSEKYLL
jgi:hypothetical protein